MQVFFFSVSCHLFFLFLSWIFLSNQTSVNKHLLVWHWTIVVFIFLFFYFLFFGVLEVFWAAEGKANLSIYFRSQSRISESDKKSDLRHAQLCLSLAHNRNARRAWRLFIRLSSCLLMEWFTINRASSALTAMGHLRWPLLLYIVCSFVTFCYFPVEDLGLFSHKLSVIYI